MAYTKLVIALACYVTAKVTAAGLSSRFEKLDPSNYLAFDCFRNSDLVTDGIITFDDCEGMKGASLC